MRTITTAQAEALTIHDRATHVRVEIANADDDMVEVTDLFDEDFLDDLKINVDTDTPIGTATLKLARKIGDYSMSPLDEWSEVNRDSSGAYAPFLHPVRRVHIYTAVMLPGVAPESSDWMLTWEGYTRPVTEQPEAVTVECRDLLSRLSTKFISDVTVYGDDGGTEDIEDVAQEILDAEFGGGAIPLEFSATAFPVREYEAGHQTVLEELIELRDLIGWNLHSRWSSGDSEHRLTLWAPDRANTTAAYTFGEDDYTAIPSMEFDDDGVRNTIEVVYVDVDGTEQTETSTDAASVALYGERFMRIDARGTSVLTSAQAEDLADAIVSDMATPKLPLEVKLPFFPWVELGDLYAFSANDQFTSEQKLAVLAFTHVLTGDDPHTVLKLSGKPSGGFARWLAKEIGDPSLSPGITEANVAITSHTGTVAETTKWTKVIPANRLGLNGGVRITMRVNPTGTAGDKRVRFKLNGTAWLDHTIGAAITDDFEYEFLIFNNRATNDQRIFSRIDRDGGTGTPSLSKATDAEDSTAAMTITATLELANAGDALDIDLAFMEYIGVAPELIAA